MDKYYESGEKINGYSILSRIGEGRYGIVYLAEDNNLRKCIIKQLKKEMLKTSKKNYFMNKKY